MDYLKSIKSRDWQLHLYATEKMCVWFHAYDNHNYAHHFIFFFLTGITQYKAVQPLICMELHRKILPEALPELHPAIYKHPEWWIFNMTHKRILQQSLTQPSH